MNKKTALLVLTGVLALASCGQQNSAPVNQPPAETGSGTTTGPITPAPTPVSEYSVTIDLEGVSNAQITVTDQNGYKIQGLSDKTVNDNDTIKLPNGTYTITGKAQNGMMAAPKTVVVNGRDTGVTLTYGKVVDPNAGDVRLTSDNDAQNKILNLEQDVNGKKRIVTYVRGQVTVDPQQQANGADRIEVFTNATTDDLNAANRIYDSRDQSGSLTFDSAKLRQGEQQYVIVRYWKGNENTTKSILIVPDNLGPQVPDIIPVSKLNAELTHELGNWANGNIKLAFQNLSTLRDNPTGTSYLASGVERVEWYADPNSNNGVADFDNAKLLGTSYNSPYEITVDTKTLKDGRYDVFAVAYDQLGNRSVVNAQNLFTLNVDNTGPSVNGGGFISMVDAGTGSVRDEFSRRDTAVTAVTFVRRDKSCKIDAQENAGNIDLYDAEEGWISGLARVTKFNFNNGISDDGVGVNTQAGENKGITIGGQPLLSRLYTLQGNQLVPVTDLAQVNKTEETPPKCSDVFLDVNGLDAGDNTVRFDFQNAATDLLGNPATGGDLKDYNLKVDNQRPSNLRFSRKPTAVRANEQAILAAQADDSISGVSGPYMYFARDTNGSAFGGRAVQLASADQTNYRFFQPTNGQSKLDVIAVVRDRAGNVSSTTDSVDVTKAGPALNVNLNDTNLFVRQQTANGQFLNFGRAQNENPVTGPVGEVHKLDLLTTGADVNSVNSSNIMQASFYEEVVLNNPLNRVGKGTDDKGVDDLNVAGTQELAPLFLLSSTESAPYASVTPLKPYLNAYHAATIDKNGNVSEVVRKIQYQNQ
ncbi:T9SS type A sorting domain-containing protein [Deinococcus sp. Marseille-Q6407]|uniref:T9SS type A sorting domain-containing protein n=1 Tax=Deinococcus sp. Marseille-Q6407 TaxID=2969223 RepID=UPI0021C10387|nr:T9SS type A sorting domain-containing protein [Deinococcus sp. Marseille-Q6407]